MMVIADTSATHNFMAKRMVSDLRLTIIKSGSKIKTINSMAHEVAGMATNIEVTIGPWSGALNFTVVT